MKTRTRIISIMVCILMLATLVPPGIILLSQAHTAAADDNIYETEHAEVTAPDIPDQFHDTDFIEFEEIAQVSDIASLDDEYVAEEAFSLEYESNDTDTVDPEEVNQDADTAELEDDEPNMPDEQVEAEPEHLPNTHTVFFISEGTSVPMQIVNTGDTATPPPSPTRADWTFMHWSLRENGAPFNFDTPILGNTVLFAVWSDGRLAEYTVVVWIEKPNIVGDPGTNSSNYMFHSSTRRTDNQRRVAGTMADYTTLAAVNTLPSSARTFTVSSGGVWAEFRHGESAMVRGNGTTVVNVYFKRLEFEYIFDMQSPGTTNGTNRRARAIRFHDGSGLYGRGTYPDGTVLSAYSFRAKYEQDIWDLWPSIQTADIYQTRQQGSGGNWNGDLTVQDNFRAWQTPSNLPGDSKIITHRDSILENMVPRMGSPASRTVTFEAEFGSTHKMEATYWFEALPHELGQEGNETLRFSSGLGFKEYANFERLNQTFQTNLTNMSYRLFNGMEYVGNSHIRNPSDGIHTKFRFFFTRNRFTLNFDTQGGTPIPAVSDIMFGDTVGRHLPADPPTKFRNNGDPLVFVGWYLDAEFFQPLDPAMTMPNRNLKLFARWTSTVIIPPSLDFGVHMVSPTTQVYRLDKQVGNGMTPLDKADIVILNPASHAWHLMVQFGDSPSDSTLKNMLRLGSNGIVGSDAASVIHSRGDVSDTENDDDSVVTYTIPWRSLIENDKDIQVVVPPGTGTGHYKATLTWTLVPDLMG
ncbi:MAG: InlB B-repeat-containing protein [Oscillospiraceae bacterium]|nr:InlB B-repeat-containing protein [Oscillospiraceae bacterium]